MVIEMVSNVMNFIRSYSYVWRFCKNAAAPESDYTQMLSLRLITAKSKTTRTKHVGDYYKGNSFIESVLVLYPHHLAVQVSVNLMIAV